MHELAWQILSYLAENPEANDTVEGIAQWWLLERRTDEPRSPVEQALAELTAAGLVSASRGADGRVRYRMAVGRKPEIQGLLARGLSG